MYLLYAVCWDINADILLNEEEYALCQEISVNFSLKEIQN